MLGLFDRIPVKLGNRCKAVYLAELLQMSWPCLKWSESLGDGPGVIAVTIPDTLVDGGGNDSRLVKQV